MKGTGIFVTKEELERVKDAITAPEIFRYTEHRTAGEVFADLERKYNPPAGSGLNLKTGEFCTR